MIPRLRRVEDDLPDAVIEVAPPSPVEVADPQLNGHRPYPEQI
jgi:hypothetical protein